MPLTVIRGDITEQAVDAIVNPTNAHFSGRGGTDGAIHRAAGPLLRLALSTKAPLAVGDAVITAGFRLPADFVIHTRGPVWRGGDEGEAEALARCYYNCLLLAEKNGCRSRYFLKKAPGAAAPI